MALICQEIGLLKDENQNQKTEMALLKETVELKDRKVHHQIDQLAKELRQRMDNFHRESPTIESNNQHLSSSEKARKSKGKRPARLLPLQLLYNRKSNGTDMVPRRFYGPPTNFSDLSKLHSGENELKISVLVVRKVLKKKLNLKNFVLNKNTVLVRHIGT